MHAKVEDVVLSLKIPRSADILVLGCGEGAFDERLIKKGYSNITSVDLYTQNKVKGVRFIKADLNDPEYNKRIGRKFDLIICIEIIEHVENHFSFLKNASELLKPSGRIVISTPNTQANLSRINTLLVGYPTWFIGDAEEGGHINPVFMDIFKLAVQKARLKVARIEKYGTLKTYLTTYGKKTLRSYAYLSAVAILYYLLNPFMLLNRDKHNNHIIVLKK